MSEDEIVVEDSASILESELTPKIRQEINPENQDLAIQMLRLAVGGNFRGIDDLINNKINEIMGE